MQPAENQGADQNKDTVLRGAEQPRKALPRGLNSLACAIHIINLLRSIAEEPAREEAGYRSGNSTPEEQTAEREGSLLRLDLCQSEECGNNHQDSVADIGKHQPEENDEKRRHQRIRINRTVGRQGVHIRNHVEPVRHPVILQLDRNIRILLRKRITGFIGTGIVLKHMGKLRLLLGWHPAFEHNNRFGSEELLFRLGNGNSGCHPVSRELHLIPTDIFSLNGLHKLLLLGSELLQCDFSFADTLPGRAFHPAHR